MSEDVFKRLYADRRCINMLKRHPHRTTVRHNSESRTMPKPAVALTIQKWGNSLAVRIPAAVARSARLRIGQPVEVSAEIGGVRVQSVGNPRLSLAQKLARFDPDQHSGEAMAVELIGAEKL
jgi:antitoxin MazE